MIDPNEGSERYEAARKSTWVSVAVNTFLTLLQLIVGFFGHSQALMADGLHSLSDLVSDFLVLFANRHSARSADAKHPYGHARMETAATLVLSIMLGAMGLALLYAAGARLQSPQVIQKVHVLALWVAVATIAAKEGLFRYMMHVAKKVRSQMLIANAWHARSDAASSLVVSVGILGNLAGFAFFDLLAAIIVGAMIVRMGWQLGHEALSELIDTGLSEEAVAKIKESLEATPGVLGLHELRTRRMANQALVEAHILVDPKISVSEGHFIAELARSRVLKLEDVLNVIVHVDPEDDFYAKPSASLPDRDQLIAHLEEALDLPPRERTIFHYLDGKVEAEIFLPGSFCEDEEKLKRLHEKIDTFVKEDNPFSVIKLHRFGAK